MPPPEDGCPVTAVAQSTTRIEVARMLALGMQRTEIARRLGLSKATISYHARRLGQSIDERCARRYDWDAVQTYYDAGHSVRECIATFGFSAASWGDAVKRGAVVARPSATPIAELLVADTYRGRYNLKLRLLREGLKENRCEGCGLTDWRGQPLTLALHHVNGQRNDNRFENLQLLCPNCHSQTGNYAGRNGRRPRVEDAVMGGAVTRDVVTGKTDEPAGPPDADDDTSVPPAGDAYAAATSEADASARGDSRSLRSSPGRSRRPPDPPGGRGRRSRRSGAGGRARGRRSDRRTRPPPRGRPAHRRR